MSVYSFRTRVSYDDIDQDLRITLKGAMRQMQEAAILHSAQCGFSIPDIPRTRVLWLLVEWRAKLVGAAYWNDSLTVETWPRTMERVTSRRNFELFGADENTVAVGESDWVLVSADTGRPVRIKPEVAASYDLTERDVFDTESLPVPQGEGVCTCTFCVSRRDIDTNHHVNNLVYLEYAREALPAEFANRMFTEVSVRYRRQLLLGDPVHCYYRKGDCCHIIDICGEERTHIHATVVYYE